MVSTLKGFLISGIISDRIEKYTHTAILSLRYYETTLNIQLPLFLVTFPAYSAFFTLFLNSITCYKIYQFSY